MWNDYKMKNIADLWQHKSPQTKYDIPYFQCIHIRMEFEPLTEKNVQVQVFLTGDNN